MNSKDSHINSGVDWMKTRQMHLLWNDNNYILQFWKSRANIWSSIFHFLSVEMYLCYFNYILYKSVKQSSLRRAFLNSIRFETIIQNTLPPTRIYAEESFEWINWLYNFVILLSFNFFLQFRIACLHSIFPYHFLELNWFESLKEKWNTKGRKVQSRFRLNLTDLP